MRDKNQDLKHEKHLFRLFKNHLFFSDLDAIRYVGFKEPKHFSRLGFKFVHPDPLVEHTLDPQETVQEPQEIVLTDSVDFESLNWFRLVFFVTVAHPRLLQDRDECVARLIMRIGT